MYTAKKAALNPELDPNPCALTMQPSHGHQLCPDLVPSQLLNVYTARETALSLTLTSVLVP